MSGPRKDLGSSAVIRHEIQRFEDVHPNIYAIYDLLENIQEQSLQTQIRNHLIEIEDSFVNSQEWTLSKDVSVIRIGILGGISSGKSSLVHRFLTGAYVHEDSPEGGRFKKDLVVDGKSHLLLIRDEGGPPEYQFSSWVDAVVLVFSLGDEASFNAIYNYYRRLSQFKKAENIPLILVGTQDSISADNPRVIVNERAKKMANEFKHCVYYETCATYGLNVDQVFQDVSRRVLLSRDRNFYKAPSIENLTSNLSTTPIPQSATFSSYDTSLNGSLSSLHGIESNSTMNLFTPTRKSFRRKGSIFSVLLLLEKTKRIPPRSKSSVSLHHIVDEMFAG